MNDGTIDALRLKMINQLKAKGILSLKEELKNTTIKMAEQSNVLNTPGAEKQTKRELFDAPRQELEAQVLEKVSKSVWELILDNNGLGKEISRTVEGGFCRLSGREPPLFPPPADAKENANADTSANTSANPNTDVNGNVNANANANASGNAKEKGKEKGRAKGKGKVKGKETAAASDSHEKEKSNSASKKRSYSEINAQGQGEENQVAAKSDEPLAAAPEESQVLKT
ncbi:hypothetical protein D8674_041272 [Pyrus ussuriensis x Pyrus communis]|uniref:Uncharacterized protein n=1 Tax=Pyrus ussuriensis x Pyrus communis TaxID=2448454 RepID=A0A5N5IHC8_9ROSA|nr:hypothetical protein D8674_041272 [Pyrus ussuriensis x Pyrus communis]